MKSIEIRTFYYLPGNHIDVKKCAIALVLLDKSCRLSPPVFLHQPLRRCYSPQGGGVRHAPETSPWRVVNVSPCVRRRTHGFWLCLYADHRIGYLLSGSHLFRPIIEQPTRVFLNLNLAKLALIHCTAGITYDPIHNRMSPRESFGTTRI